MRAAPLAVGALLCAVRVAGQSPFFVPPNFAGNGPTVTADFNGDGKPDLVNADGTVLLGKGDGTFTTAAALSVTGTSIVTGDFNGDGKADVIIANSSTSLSVLLGNGDGTFQAAITVNAGASLKSLVVADFNGDGKLDVAGVNDTSGLFVLLGKGTGSFTAASGSPIALMAGSLIVAGDFNGDGKADFAYGSGTAGGVFLSNGDGTFKKGSPLTISSGGVKAVAAADLNNRGKLDLVFSGSSTVVLLGNGDGTFQPIDSSLPGGGNLAIADLTGNHQQNIIVDDQVVVRVFAGLGDGTYLLQNTYVWAPSVGGNAFVLAADFNGDGKMDIAAGGVMLLGNGDGSLRGNDASVFVGGGISGGAVGDFNGDGSPDVVTSSGSNLQVLLNDGTGKFIQAHSYPNPNSAFPIAVSDLNHDGKLDVLLAVPSGALSLSVMLGNGDGTFGTAKSTSIGDLSTQSVSSIRLVDLDGDQIPDLVLLTTQGVSAYLGKGDGTFSAAANYFAGSNPMSLQVGDFNNDGKQDIAVGSAASIGVLPGKGDGTFLPVVLSGTGAIGFSTVGDINGDGNLDLIAPGNSIIVYLGNGDGTFQAGVNSGTPGPINGLSNITTADVDGDGKLDVVAGTGIYYATGNGDGTFASPINVLRGGSFAIGPFVEAVADFNGDGRPDVLIMTSANEPEQGFATFLNINGATLPNFTITATPATPGNVEPGSSATSTVTVTPLSGFSANVALSCLGLPVGASCAFTPASAPGASVTAGLSINVGSTVAAGTYYISVVGSGGGFTRSRLLTVVVTGTPDFAVSAGSGGTSTVAAGKPATYSLSVGGSGGFSGTVALSCSGAPTGATCTISPAMVMVSGSTATTATVTVTTTARSEMVTPTADRTDRWTPGIYGTPRVIEIYAAIFAALFGLVGIVELRRRWRMVWAPVAAGVLMLAGAAMSGCGGSNGSNPSGGSVNGTPAGTYTIVVTATAGNGANAVSHTTNLTLVVQ